MAFKMKGPTFFNLGKTKEYAKQNPSTAFQQTDEDLTEYLRGEGFSSKEIPSIKENEGYDKEEFKAWYASKEVSKKERVDKSGPAKYKKEEKKTHQDKIAEAQRMYDTPVAYDKKKK
tara:strand:+ start:445 stop:795 length:351 start_codon:yes stop_codon:yes gene_type:complete